VGLGFDEVWRLEEIAFGNEDDKVNLEVTYGESFGSQCQQCEAEDEWKQVEEYVNLTHWLGKGMYGVGVGDV
jgi:hypothetical protein